MIYRRAISILLSFLLVVTLLPMSAFAEPVSDEVSRMEWVGTGNSDLNILNGGVMLNDGEDFYFTNDGIFVKRGESVFALSADEGKNLNLWNGYLYYTLGNLVYRIPAMGGDVELIHTAPAVIKQLYVIGGSLRYIAEGRAYGLEAGDMETYSLGGPENIIGLIPTQYGDLFLTGEAFDYTLWEGENRLIDGVFSCYTDSGYLALCIDGNDYMISIPELFDGFDASSKLQEFSIHGDASLMQLLSPDDENAICEYNDNHDLECDFSALLEAAGLKKSEASLMTVSGEDEILETTPGEDQEPIIPPVSEGQQNIVKRARQLHEIEWTPLEDRYQWGYRGVFKAEATYKGIPYGQPVTNNGYIGYGVSPEGFLNSVLNNTSVFYSKYASYNKVAPYFSTDCSGFVSYAWGLTQRRTTYSVPYIAEKVGDQSIYSLQVGDCLDRTSSHIVLVSGLTYDAEGSIVGVEIMEQTPVITKLTRYGPGEKKSLASLQSYYLNGGYEIYRYPDRDSVTYTPSPVVPLDGEIAPGQKDKAPKTKTTSFVGGKTVELYSDDNYPIYYTLDGSTPSLGSTPYTAPISVYDTTKLRAVAVSGNFPESTVLEYTVKVPQAEKPQASVVSGVSCNGLISSGSTVKLQSSPKATIYYTTDGSEPTTSSRVYTSPITVSSDVTIKAMAQGPGMHQSNTSQISYRIGTVYTITAESGNGGSISPQGRVDVMETSSATFRIKPGVGYKISSVLVDGTDVGAVSTYTISNVNAPHTIRAVFSVDANIPFTDVDSGMWYYDAISFAYAKGLFNGTSATTFSPNNSMTRGMFITVLGRVAGIGSNLESGIAIVSATGVNIRGGPSTNDRIVGFVTNRNTVVQVLGKTGDWYNIKYGAVTGYIRGDLLRVYEENYSDLAAGQYYTAYAQWACVSGIADGVAAGTFRADEPINREQMSLMLYNYTKAYGKTLKQVNPQTTFADDYQISQNAKTAVYALQRAGVVNGVGNGLFNPQGTAERSHVAQIYMNLLKALS